MGWEYGPNGQKIYTENGIVTNAPVNAGSSYGGSYANTAGIDTVQSVVPSAYKPTANANTSAFGPNAKPITTPGANQDVWGTGMNGNQLMSGFGTAIQGAAALGSYFQGEKALEQADEQFEFQKDSWEKRFAMMQDQYYRKLNNRRALSNMDAGMSAADRKAVGTYYDSGANLSRDMTAGAPTVANANMMDQATGGAPYSPAAAQGMLNAGSSAFNKNVATPAGSYAQPSPGQAPVNPSTQPSNGAVTNVVRRKKPKPTTQSGNPAGTAQAKPQPQ